MNSKLFVTQHEKIGFTCTQNLTTFQKLNFNNFLSKHSLPIKLLLLMQLTIVIPLYYFNSIHRRLSNVKRCILCTYIAKSGFLMLGHNCL